MQLTDAQIQVLKPLAIEWLLTYGTAGVNYMLGRADELSDAMLEVFNKDAAHGAHEYMFFELKPNDMSTLNPEFLKQLGLHEENAP